MILCAYFKLYDKEGELNWVIFHDVLVTSRVFIRTVCPIRYEWVKDLLPKLHEVDVYELSSVAKEEVTEEEIIKWEKREAAKRQPGVLENLFDMFARVVKSQSPITSQRITLFFSRGFYGGCHGEAEKAK